jgi:hypothetical protein
MAGIPASYPLRGLSGPRSESLGNTPSRCAPCGPETDPRALLLWPGKRQKKAGLRGTPVGSLPVRGADSFHGRTRRTAAGEAARGRPGAWSASGFATEVSAREQTRKTPKTGTILTPTPRGRAGHNPGVVRDSPTLGSPFG